MLDFILAFMEASPGKCDVSCVRTLISVWAPTSQKTREKAVQLFGDGVLYVEYSATEMGVAGQMVTGGYLVPKSIDFVADFPRTAAGKVQKSLLRKTYWEGVGRKI